MANNTDVKWAIYTGDRAPIRSDNPIWCAWHANHALFATEIAPGQAIGACSVTQIGGLNLAAVQEATWTYAEHCLTMTICPRAHIMNFRKDK